MRQAAQDYIVSPQAGPVPLEVQNIEVRSSTGCKEHVATDCMEEDTGSQFWTVLCVPGCPVSGDPGRGEQDEGGSRSIVQLHPDQ